MTARKKKTFEEKIISEARANLRKQLYDYSKIEDGEIKEPKVGIPYTKRQMEKIKDSLDAIIAEGKRQNVEIYLNSKYPQVLFCKYIFFQSMKDWDV